MRSPRDGRAHAARAIKARVRVARASVRGSLPEAARPAAASSGAAADGAGRLRAGGAATALGVSDRVGDVVSGVCGIEDRQVVAVGKRRAVESKSTIDVRRVFSGAEFRVALHGRHAAPAADCLDGTVRLFGRQQAGGQCHAQSMQRDSACRGRRQHACEQRGEERRQLRGGEGACIAARRESCPSRARRRRARKGELVLDETGGK
eukprot:4613717-Pleurochrysis_carterae.AAC.1